MRVCTTCWSDAYVRAFANRTTQVDEYRRLVASRLAHQPPEELSPTAMRHWAEHFSAFASSDPVVAALADVLTATADLHPAMWRVQHSTTTNLLNAIANLARVLQDAIHPAAVDS